MVLFGSCSTIFAKLMDQTIGSAVTVGDAAEFKHPLLMNQLMFTG